MTKLFSFYSLLLLFISLTGFAQAPQLRSAVALTTKLEKQTYTGALKEGFHFNYKAPNNVNADGKNIQPSQKDNRQIRFDLPAGFKNAQAQLYVCDDAITYCETHTLNVKGAAVAATTKTLADKSGKAEKDEHGFYNGQLEKALQEAKKKNQLVLLDFTAIWCPGCQRNKNEIFGTAEFKKLTKDVVKVKIDTDLFENFKASEQYQIKGIPTLILVNANNNEIDRLVGFEPIDKLKTFVGAAQKDPTPIQDWMKLDASADQATQLKAGQRLLASGKTAESIPFLGRVQPAPPELLYAKVTAAQEAYEKDKDNVALKEAFAKEVRDALKQEPSSTRSIGWRVEFVRLNPKSDEAKKAVADGVQLADELMKDDEKLKKAVATDSIGEFKGYEKWVVASYKADLVEASEAPEDEQIKVMSEAADLGIQYKIPMTKQGPALRQLVMLTSAKRWPEAEMQINQLLQQAPKNTDYKRRKVRILNALKKYGEAVKLAEQILPSVEGRNEFWVAELLAKSYIGLEKKDEAKRVLTAYLTRP